MCHPIVHKTRLHKHTQIYLLIYYILTLNDFFFKSHVTLISERTKQHRLIQRAVVTLGTSSDP